MPNFQDIFETHKRSFISAFSICMTVPLSLQVSLYKHNHIIQFSKCCSWLPLKTTFRNSRSQMFFKNGVLKNFAILTGKHLCWNNFIKKKSNKDVFLWILQKFPEQIFYRTPPVGFFWIFILKYLKLLLLKETQTFKAY